MGAAVGGVLTERGHRVLVALDDRSRASVERASAAGLHNVGVLADLVAKADLVLSIVPPAAALAVAESVREVGGAEVYVDANAVSPATAARIADLVGPGFVDGDLIGGPPRPGGGTRLYLSGDGAPAAAEVLGGDGLEAVVVEGAGPYAASALKMAYAAWTKGTAALLLAIQDFAAAHGVEEPLRAEWERTQPDLPGRAERARGVLPKAWRFSGEMHEIADAFAAAGLPEGFARAAAEVYEGRTDR
jgi:3-hydroxyisobutyrate dehydrogenase-like beta-hydroxyacid dehydrogenase